MLIGLGRRHESDVHTANLVDLFRLDLRKNDLLGDAEGVVASTVETALRHPLEVAHTRDRDANQTVIKFIHTLASKRDHSADGLALAQLESRDGLLGLGEHRLL